MNNESQNIKKIEVGKFYLIHDGSKKGHPGFLIWKDDNANLYFLIKFGSSSNSDNISFPHLLSKNKDNNYVYKRPYLAKRKDIGKEWVFDFGLNDSDKDILDNIVYSNPIYSKSIRRKDRRYFSLIVKRRQIKTVL